MPYVVSPFQIRGPISATQMPSTITANITLLNAREELSCEAPYFTWAQLEPYLWGFNEFGEWTPDDQTLPLGSSYLRITDVTTQDWIDIGLIHSEMDPGPVVWLSQHLIIKKDIGVGGAITSFQGALLLGSGFEGQSDMPQIVLAHSETTYGNMDTLEIKRFNHAGYAKLKCATLFCDEYKKIDGTTLNIPNQELNTDDNAVFNSVKGTDGTGAVKAGDEGTLGWNVDYFTLTSHVKHLLLATPTDKHVYVQRNLHVYGNITCDGSYPSGSVYWNDILNKPSAFPPESHTHNASHVTSGVFATARIPNIFDQSLNKANDTQFSTVLCTNGTGSVKCGASTVAVALSLGYDASNGYLTAHSKNLVINAVSGVINMQNDTNFAGLINIRGGSINIQTSGGTNRVQFGHDGSNAYLTSLSGLLTLTGSGGIWLYGGNVSIRGGYHLVPETYETGQLGNSSYPWYASYVREVWAKNPHTYGCEPSKSDQYWERKCSSREVAEEVLTHEVTKWRKHIKYADPSKSTDIMCVCGKVGNAPCPEHYHEWADTYGVNIGDMIEAASFLILELDAQVTKLQTRVEELENHAKLQSQIN